MPFRSPLPTCAWTVIVAALATAGPVAAHHSFAMYDASKLVTVTGTVKEFQWSNPHPILWLSADAAKDGPAELWSLELSSSPGPLSRLGWSKHSLRPGDRILVEMNPLHDGQRGGSMKKATVLATGQVLTTTSPVVQGTVR